MTKNVFNRTWRFIIRMDVVVVLIVLVLLLAALGSCFPQQPPYLDTDPDRINPVGDKRPRSIWWADEHPDSNWSLSILPLSTTDTILSPPGNLHPGVHSQPMEDIMATTRWEGA